MTKKKKKKRILKGMKTISKKRKKNCLMCK